MPNPIASKRGPRLQIGFSASYKHWAKPCQTRLPRNTDHDYKSGFPLLINIEPSHAKPDCRKLENTTANLVFRFLETLSQAMPNPIAAD